MLPLEKCTLGQILSVTLTFESMTFKSSSVSCRPGIE